MNEKPKFSRPKRRRASDPRKIIGKTLIGPAAPGFVAQLARMPNVGEDSDFARVQTDSRSSGGKKEIAAFNSSDYLHSEGVIAAYLTAALQNPDSEAFMMALSNVAKAREITEIAKLSRIGSRVLQKELAPHARLSFETVHRLVNALGVRWAVVPQASSTVTEIRERLARRPTVTTRATAAKVLRRERNSSRKVK